MALRRFCCCFAKKSGCVDISQVKPEDEVKEVEASAPKELEAERLPVLDLPGESTALEAI